MQINNLCLGLCLRIRYIAPEQVPVKYGGLHQEGEREFTTTDPVTKITINPAAKHKVEVPVSEVCFTRIVLFLLYDLV